MRLLAALRIPAEVGRLSSTRQFVRDAAAAAGAAPEPLADVVLAVDEAVTNIIVHGYQGRPGEIALEVRHDGDALIIVLRDQAPAFDPTQVPPPNLDLPLEERPVGGLGVHFMRQIMDAVHYRALAAGGNELTLIKRGLWRPG